MSRPERLATRLHNDESKTQIREVSAMPVMIERASADDLHERLRRTLAEVGMTEAELADLAARYMLTPEELAAWDEVRAIRFLLGGE